MFYKLTTSNSRTVNANDVIISSFAAESDRDAVVYALEASATLLDENMLFSVWRDGVCVARDVRARGVYVENQISVSLILDKAKEYNEDAFAATRPDSVFDHACGLIDALGARAFACELIRALPTDTLWECMEWIERTYDIRA